MATVLCCNRHVQGSALIGSRNNSMLLHTWRPKHDNVHYIINNSMTNLLSEFKSCNQHRPKQRTHTLAFLSLSAGVSVHTERSPQSVRPVRNFLAPKPTDTQAQIQSATLIRNHNGKISCSVFSLEITQAEGQGVVFSPLQRILATSNTTLKGFVKRGGLFRFKQGPG